MSSLLELRNLSVQFPARGSATALLTAVRDVSLSLDSGEVLGLVGESGSGKSATALAILRLLPPQARASGEVAFEGRNLLTAEDDAMRAIRGARISMIFQEPMTALNPVMRVGDQVAEAVMAHGIPRHVREAVLAQAERGDVQAFSDMLKTPFFASQLGKRLGYGFEPKPSNRMARKLAVDALRDVQLPDPEQRARDYPHQLSGGMRQRVMIAMAIVNRPQLLIADEPTTALDVTIQAQILELLTDLRRKFNLAMLFISHDLAVVSQVSDRVAVMYAGSIVELAPTRDLFARPGHPYTRGLIESAPSLRTDRTRPLQTVEGAVPALGLVSPGCPFEPRCALRESRCSQEMPPLEEIAPGHWARCPVLNKK